MKTIGLREAKQGLSETVNRSQKEPLCILKHSRPAAVLVGIEGVSLEEAMTMPLGELLSSGTRKKARKRKAG